MLLWRGWLETVKRSFNQLEIINNWVTVSIKRCSMCPVSFQTPASSNRTRAAARTTPWSGSMTPNRTNALASGTAAATATKTASQRRKSVSTCVWPRVDEEERITAVHRTLSAEPSGTRVFKEQYKISEHFKSFIDSRVVLERFSCSQVFTKTASGKLERSRTLLLVKDILFLSWTCVFSFFVVPSFCESLFKQTSNISQ